MNYSYRTLAAFDVDLLKQLLKVFAEAFEDFQSYQTAVPSDEYLKSLLNGPHFIAVVALIDAPPSPGNPASPTRPTGPSNSEVVGGLAAYQLDKFEQDRREIYIYDLAVAASHRRQGVATAIVQELKRVAVERRAYVIYVQADKGDAAAIRLYESLGIKEDVYHFDIAVEPSSW